MAVSKVEVRTKFFSYLFGRQVGYLCIATATPTAMQTDFKHTYFEWPLESNKAAHFIERESVTHNVWFCVSLMRTQIATKDGCLPGSFVWSDLDSVTPDDLAYKSVPATSIVETSPGNYQGYWRLDMEVPPDVREDLSKKITYYVGADKGGWACNKLMRVPFTRNHKYSEKPIVELLNAFETLIPVAVFEGLPEAAQDPGAIPSPDMPDLLALADVSGIMYKYSAGLVDTAFRELYLVEPDEDADWSARMWRLINICLEARMEKEEAFAIALNSACNKYKRDNRPVSYLWREVVKADSIRHKGLSILGDYSPLKMPGLVDPNLEVDNFVTRYVQWASEATDAVKEYHELCGFIMLSCLLASSIRLEASFGRLYPNLWGLILGDSTLTRKTTAMDLALSYVREIDKDSIVATDGSPEGLVTVLSTRPEAVSIFYKDEVSGFFSAINNKSYLSDMPELLTKMYDVPEYYPRVLRKETIVVRKPYFIFFGGGIQEKVYAEVTEDYVLQGFLPRFLVVSGYANLDTLRPVGPPSLQSATGRAKITAQLLQIYEQYCLTINIKVGSQLVPVPQVVEAKMDDDAWNLFAEFDDKLVRTAAESPLALFAQPTFTRLGFSLLKMAMLLAACRGVDSAKRIHITTQDLNEAASFVQRWGRHSIDLISNAGITKSERITDRIMKTIVRHPGCTKTFLMRTHSNLSAKEMGDLITTICERGLIEVKKEGRGFRFWAIGQ